MGSWSRAVLVLGCWWLVACGASDSPGDAVAEVRDAVAEASDGGTDVSDAGSDVPDGSDVGDPVPPLFVDGCPAPGLAQAREITNPALRVEGPDAVARPGDFLLVNEVAAFVIEGVEHHNTYSIYSGIPVDAVALEGCRQAGPERFEELAFMMGTLDVARFERSTLRAFRPERVEVLADGADGGPAVVRATGTDDTFWLVEDELLRRALQGGAPRQSSVPFGLAITIDYVLEPGSRVLRIDLAYRNTSPEPLPLLAGEAILFGDQTGPRYYADASVSAAGLELDGSVPWIAASAGEGAWAFAMAGAAMGTLEISGVRAFLDTRKVLAPGKLSGAGGDHDTLRRTVFLAVGPTDANSATRGLHAVNPEPIPSGDYVLAPLAGVVHAAGNGQPVAGARVELQARNSGGRWGVLDSFVSGVDGAFGGQVPAFGHKNLPLQLQAFLPGHPPSAPLPVDVASPAPVRLELPPSGALTLDVRDATTTTGLPAKVLLWQGGAVARRFHPTGAPLRVDVEPGTYTASVTRGFEYTSWQGEVVVVAGETTDLAVRLERVVDTRGFLSFDGHVHAGPSADNDISIPERLATVAAEGLEVVASTDHEYISDWGPAVQAAGLGAFVATLPGQEVTATLPEHLNVYPVEPDLEASLRGGIIPWYGRPLGELFGMLRARAGGGGIVQLNHPRQGCNYLCLAGYDRVLGTTTLPDATWLGYPAGTPLWSWDFDAVEYQNGSRPVYVVPGQEETTGFLDDWLSFLNHGHRVTALGNSDAHDWSAPGQPRNLYASPTDDPAAFERADLVEAIRAGRVVVSSGAFARVSLNGTAGLGDTVTDTDGQVALWLRVEAPPAIDVTYAKVFVNCDQALVIPATDPGGVVKLEGTFDLPVATDAHVVVLAFGAAPMPPGFDGYDAAATPRVTTNAIYVDADGDGAWQAPGGKACVYEVAGP